MAGKTLINESVFMDIAREALRNVGNVLLQDKKGFTKVLTDRLTPQITVKKEEPAEDELDKVPSVAFEVKLTVIYGVRLPEVAAKVREKIIEDVEALTGYNVEKVDIIVEKIVKPEEIHEGNNEGNNEENNEEEAPTEE